MQINSYGYWVVSQDLLAYPQLAVIGIMGKTFGPIGWFVAVQTNQAPASTLSVNVFNDLIWLPFFIWYVVWAYGERKAGSARFAGRHMP